MVAVALLAGPPWLLWSLFGNPVGGLLTWWGSGPFTDDPLLPPAGGLRIAGIWVGWLLWALLSTLLVGSLVGVVRRRRLPRWRLPMPVHRLLFGLTGTATVALVSTPAVAATAVHATTGGQQTATVTANAATGGTVPSGAYADAGRLDPAARPAVFVVGDDRYEHRVRRGDTLSKVAKIWLQDPDRWGDICRLNKHRHFATGTLTDCDLIYPGWELRLPADATPPRDARSKPKPPTRTPDNAAPPDASGSVEPSTSPQASPAPSTPSAPSTDSSEQTAGPARDSQADDLVLPGGNIIPWALAAAISATAALVWLQRRRRYRPGTEDDLRELPAAVRAAQRHTRENPAEEFTANADRRQLPAGGIGLIGAGADAATRGLIITALTAGSPSEPGRRAEVIIDRQTLNALIGDTPIAAWSRIHITDTLEQTLQLLETQVLHRTRNLDDHQLTDLDLKRETAPAEETLPPLLVVAGAEHAAANSRARITFAVTGGLDITVIVVGHWPHGHTITVSDQGRTAAPAGADIGDQLAVLDPATTRDLLTATREAHTGEPATPLASAPAHPAEQEQTPAPAPTDRNASRAETATGDHVVIRVLGAPTIDGVTAPGRPLRRKAAELAVYLACHPDGADTDTLSEHLLPDARISQARQQIHTNASNLRHVLGRAGGLRPSGYVTKNGPSARYRLDPEAVQVDLWRFNDLIGQARYAVPADRLELLQQACSLATAPLADGCDYEWITPHRERARRAATEAHLALAEQLLGDDPSQAATIIQQAIALDPYQEELYRQAMRVRHALHDPDGIHTYLRTLTRALHDIDAEPAGDTVELAQQLLADLRAPQPPTVAAHPEKRN